MDHVRHKYSLVRPRASFPEIKQPRLSLNSTAAAAAASSILKQLMPLPRPLYREHSSHSSEPLTAAEHQLTELDGGSSFYSGSGSGGGVGCGGCGGGGGGGGGGAEGGGGADGAGDRARGTAGDGFHTTELSITPTTMCDEQIIDLGSLRRFSIDRHSFLDLGSKLGMSQPKFGQSVSQQGFFSSHDSLSTSCVTRASNPHVATVCTASELDLSQQNAQRISSGSSSHKNTNANNTQRHKSRGRLKAMSGDQPLLGSWQRGATTRALEDSTFDGPLAANSICNGTDRYSRRAGGCLTSVAPHKPQQLPHQLQHHLQHSAATVGAPHAHLHAQSAQQPFLHHQPHPQTQPLTPQLQQQPPTQSQSHSQARHRRTASQRLRAAAASRKFTFVFDPAGRLCYYWSMVVSLAFIYNIWVIIYRFAFQEINRRTIVVWFCLDYLADLLYLVDILFHFRTGYLEDGVLQTDSTKLRQHYMNSTTFYIDCLCLLPLDFLYLSIGFNSILRSFRLVKIYRFWAFMDRTERHTNYPNLFRSCSLLQYLLVIYHWNACLYYIIHKNNGFGSRNWVYHDTDSDDVVKHYLQSYYWCTLALTTIGDLPKPRSKGEYVFVIMQLLFGLLLFATVLGHVANIVTSVSAARKEFQAKLDGVKTYMRMRRVPNHLQVKVIKWFDYLWLTQKCSDEERAVSCLPDKLKAEIAINVHLDTLKRVEIFQNTEAGFLCELVLRLRPVLFSPGDYICRKGEVGKEMYIVNRGRLQVVADNGKTVMASLKAGSYFGEISILNMGTAGKELVKYFNTVAMGRCQSTPGLVESEGRTTLEDMWLPPASNLPYIAANAACSRAASPHASHAQAERMARTAESPGSMSPSSEDRPRSRAASHLSTRPQSQPSRSGTSHICDSSSHLECYAAGATPLLGSHEALEDEIKRLRERLHTVESENQALNSKLSQQQWDLENRLAEIEMQICGVSSTSSLDPEHEAEELERNRESII